MVVAVAALAVVSCSGEVAAGEESPVAVRSSSAGSPPTSCAADTGVVWTHEADDGPWELYRLACDGSAQPLTRSLPGQGGSESPRWGRCGTLYFDSDRADGAIHAFRLWTSTGKVDQVTRTDGSEMSPAPTPDGKQLVIEHAAADGSGDGLFVAPNRVGVRADTFRRLTRNPAPATGGFDSAADVSPDGGTVVFLRTLSTTAGIARSAVFTVGMDGRGLRRLTPYAMNAFVPRWSPNGKRIVFSDNGDNFSGTVSADVWVMDRDGTRLARVTHNEPGSHSFSPVWGPAGALLYVQVAPDTQGTSIVRRDLTSGQVETLYQGADGIENMLDWGSCAGR